MEHSYERNDKLLDKARFDRARRAKRLNIRVNGLRAKCGQRQNTLLRSDHRDRR